VVATGAEALHPTANKEAHLNSYTYKIHNYCLK
jgi:hypothetical protein